MRSTRPYVRLFRRFITSRSTTRAHTRKGTQMDYNRLDYSVTPKPPSDNYFQMNADTHTMCFTHGKERTGIFAIDRTANNNNKLKDIGWSSCSRHHTHMTTTTTTAIYLTIYTPYEQCPYPFYTADPEQ